MIVPDVGNNTLTGNFEPTWAGSGTVDTSTDGGVFTITVLTGGITVDIINNNASAFGATQSAVSFVTATPLALGTSGHKVTPTFGTAVVAGAKWRVFVTPAGIKYQPISDSFETLTLHIYFDGLLHKMKGAMGNGKMMCAAGDIAQCEFTFLGQYVSTSDSALPSDAIYEKELPSQIQESNFTFDSNDTLTVQEWTFDTANTEIPRPDINGTDGYNGIRLTDRVPAGGFTPEAELEATEPFWGKFEGALTSTFYTKIGTVPGNQIFMFAPAVQADKLAYQDKDGIRVYENSLKFRRGPAGNDDYVFVIA